MGFSTLILLLLINFVSLFDVSFNIRCDDYCTALLDGTSIVRTYQKKKKNSFQSYSGTFSLSDSIGIVCLNDEGGFGLVGEADFSYIKVSTNDIELWKVGIPGESCYGVNYSYNSYDKKKRFRFISIFNDGSLNYQSCTFQSSTNFCRENIFYFQHNSGKKEFDYKTVILTVPF